MLKQIKALLASVKQQFCDHNSNYTEIKYYVTNNHTEKIRRCNECGFGSKEYDEVHNLLLERDKMKTK